MLAISVPCPPAPRFVGDRASVRCGSSGHYHRCVKARAGEARLLKKGSLHTDELIAAAPDHELRTERRVNNVYLIDVGPIRDRGQSPSLSKLISIKKCT